MQMAIHDDGHRPPLQSQRQPFVCAFDSDGLAGAGVARDIVHAAEMGGAEGGFFETAITSGRSVSPRRMAAFVSCFG